MSNEDSKVLISLVQDVVRERNVHEDDVYFAIEYALLELARARYGDADLTLKIDRNTGEIALLQNCKVVDSNPDCTQISLAQALLINPQAVLDDKVGVKLNFDSFNRVGAHTAKNLLYKNLDQLRRVREIAEFTPRIGEVVTCIVKQTSNNGDLVVNVGKGIGSLRRMDLLPNEVDKYRPGDRIEAYIKNVTDKFEQQIHLSRAHNDFLAKLLIAQVPELLSGEVEIKNVVREPGRKAKVAVYSNSPKIDPVRVCVGQSGSRIQAVIAELKGERIDVIPFDTNVVKFAVNALKPGEAKQAIFRANNDNIILVVADDQKNKAIGEFGSNVKLASALTNTNISVLTLAEFGHRKRELEKFFEVTLEIDNDIAELLVSKGFETIHDINTASSEELAASTNMDLELIDALKERIAEYTQETNAYLSSVVNLDYGLLKVPGLKTPYIKALAEHGINTMAKLGVQTPEKISEILSSFCVAGLSIGRFISYAAKQSNLVSKFSSMSNRREYTKKPEGYRPDNRREYRKDS